MEAYDQKMFEEALIENGGSDLIIDANDSKAESTNNGDDEDSELTEEEKSRKAYNHLNTVDSNWYTVDRKSLQMFIPTGKPPSTILESEWKEIRERSLKFGVPDERRFPTIWLLLQSRKLKIYQPFVLKKIAELDQLSSLELASKVSTNAGVSVSVLWILCVLKYNGYVSILKHLNRVAKDPCRQGSAQLPKDFSLQFYEFKNVDADDDADRKRTILMDLPPTKNKSTDNVDDDDDDEDDEEKVLEELSKNDEPDSTDEPDLAENQNADDGKRQEEEKLAEEECSGIDDLLGDGDERFPE